MEGLGLLLLALPFFIGYILFQMYEDSRYKKASKEWEEKKRDNP